MTAYNPGHNVTGAITVGGTTTQYSADDLATPQDGSPYLSAFYNSPYSGSWFVVTFGTDSSLPTTKGWDPVTGVGSPNGDAFVTAISGG